MSFISKLTIQEVNNRMDAISIINDYIRLEKKGGRWWGKCPFHGGGQEKTPSFKVDPDLKSYYCFGCGKGGGIINFVMEMDKLTFPEVIKTLADKLGIKIIYEEGGQPELDNSVRDQLYEVYRRLTLTFQHFLHQAKNAGASAKKYLTDRGISDEMIERFKIGFSPEDKNFLHNFLTQKGFSPDFLEKTGLFSSRYKTYPLFCGRLMFPISDRQGRVIAFGGRIMPGVLQSDGREPPKYINSPENEIYKKGQTLYGFDLALAEIRKTKCVYLAEGYMDVITLHQAGVTNSIAPLGTSFTDEQAILLRRWAEKIILIFDTDEAGQKAAYRAILTCRKNGLSCGIVQLQSGLKAEKITQNIENFKDPADIFQKFGADVLKNIVKFVILDIEYLINRSKSQHNADTSGKNHALVFLFPYLESLNSEIERDDCITLLADSFGINRDAVLKDYSRRKTGKYRQEDREKNSNNHSPIRQIRMNKELFLLTVVSVNMELYDVFRSNLEIKDIEDAAAKELFIAMEECFIHDESGLDCLLSRISDDNLRNYITGRGASPEFKGSDGLTPYKLMEDGIKAIKKKKLEKRSIEIGAQLRKGERSLGLNIANENENDVAYIDELIAEKMYIDTQIRKLEGRNIHE